ncbi:MAG TPA: nitroreductase family protein [Acidimicrobiales bacterium]|nr:nitroreductase family protein [Acidimicrobiales bacterium]
MADPTSSTPFDLAETDRLLSTTRAVRKRLDLGRPVEPEVLLDCIRLSQQAPTGSNNQGWRWMIVTDPGKRAALAELYRAGGAAYLERQRQTIDAESQIGRVMDSATWLAQNIEHVPVHVIPCIKGRLGSDAPAMAWAAQMGSIFPAVWSFQLALRARGLGSVITSFHLASERQVAELLDIPDDVMQVALLPVAYTKGTDFRPAHRPPPERITHWDSWGNKRQG